MEKFVNRVIRRDVIEITGVDFFTCGEVWNNIIKNNTALRIFMCPYDQMAYKELFKTISAVFNKYLVWREDSGIEPLQLYVKVYENWDNIMEEMTEGLTEDPTEGFLEYFFRINIYATFRNFANMLIKVGNVHKFNRTHIEERIFIDETEED